MNTKRFCDIFETHEKYEIKCMMSDTDQTFHCEPTEVVHTKCIYEGNPQSWVIPFPNALLKKRKAQQTIDEDCVLKYPFPRNDNIKE